MSKVDTKGKFVRLSRPIVERLKTAKIVGNDTELVMQADYAHDVGDVIESLSSDLDEALRREAYLIATLKLFGGMCLGSALGLMLGKVLL